MRNAIAAATAWVATSAAVIYGIHATGSPHCLWVFILPYLASGVLMSGGKQNE